jgi:hypothetical protein
MILRPPISSALSRRRRRLLSLSVGRPGLHPSRRASGRDGEGARGTTRGIKPIIRGGSVGRRGKEDSRLMMSYLIGQSPSPDDLVAD